MNRSFAFLAYFFLTVAFPAQAQAADDSFCSLAPTGMLAALGGTWNFTQGAGFATAGPISVPLPAHPAQPLTLTYDPTTGVATLTGAAPGETMIMVPTTPEAAATVVSIIGEADMEEFLEIGTGCDWHSIPLMIGTNIYSLDSFNVEEQWNSFTGVFAGWGFRVCEDTELSGGGRSGVYVNFWPADESREWNLEREAYPPCDRDEGAGPPLSPALIEGEMSMSLAVKFQSSSNGTGMLIFKGSQGGYPFAAKAPVSFSR